MRIQIYSIILQIIIGFILADFFAGFFHWFEDTYLDYCIDIPIISQISKDNELHHYFPRSMIAYSYLEHVSITFPLAFGILFVLYVINKSLFRYRYFIFSLAFFSIVSNIAHRFSHMRDCENHAIVRFLQKTGILCSHEHHSIHHKKSTEKYCVISEYTNYILDTLHFWRILEYVIYVVTGIKPSRKQSYDDYYEIHNHMHENAKLECPDTTTKRDVEELIQKLKEYRQCNT